MIVGEFVKMELVSVNRPGWIVRLVYLVMRYVEPEPVSMDVHLWSTGFGLGGSSLPENLGSGQKEGLDRNMLGPWQRRRNRRRDLR